VEYFFTEEVYNFISIHHNTCTGGDDTEILCYLEERGENFAWAILPELWNLDLEMLG